jgi:hypothetical protein
VYLVNGSGLINVIGAHFHQGPVGTAGPIVVPLNGSNGVFGGVSDRLTAAQVASWKVLGFYANIHTAAFPNGEIRGQMIPDAGDHWVAAADSAQETPPTGSPGLAGAHLIVDLNGVITVTGSFNGLTGAAVAAHVHVGAPGVAGPIVFPLTISGSRVSGAYTPTPTDLLTLRAGGWYINIHTALNPNGEVRGQFFPSQLPTTFGEGCPTSAGTRPQAAGPVVTSVGSTFSLDLFGALPQSLLVFAMGSNRDTAGGIPLPVELPTVGIPANGCYVLIEPAATVVRSADALGNSGLILSVPFLPALRGGTFFTQWVVLDPAAAGGLATSSALSFTIQ